MIIARVASNLWRKSGTLFSSLPLSKAEIHSAAGANIRASSSIVELRQYQLHPTQTSVYTQNTIQLARLHKNLPLAFVGFPETGAIALNTAVHVYHYPGGHVERLDKRSALASNQEMLKYSGSVNSESSEIFVEAPLVTDFDEITGLKYWVDNDRSGARRSFDFDIEEHPKDSSNTCIIELRKYQLKLGYDTVPKFLHIYSDALPSKLNANGTHPTTELVSILVSDVGRLNTVYEVWKHGGEIVGHDTSFCGLHAMEMSRQASRGATEWRNGIMRIAELAMTFDTTILKPLECSPLR
ncbi:hypothetical protein ACHAW5_006125 [Stephanodiscus triporus]|uniref:Uncharacterized protein n=1 Tax=Stephanodiscus triporus TaxID=2934178 RepID=A0ABD3MCU6_9STRA